MEEQANPNQEIPKSEVIDRTFELLYVIGAMRAALELKLWEKIASGEDTAKKIASQEGWDAFGTRTLLDAICALKLLNKEGDRYTLAPESAYYLIPGKPTYKGDILLNEYGWEGNGKLEESIRTGKRPLEYDATTADVVGIWIADYSRRWVYPENYFENDEKFWQSVSIHAIDGLNVLDLACGPAPMSMALARNHPGVNLTWLDWDEVLTTALKVASQLGFKDQVSPLPGDLWLVDMGENLYNLSFLGNVTHFFSPDRNTYLFSKVYAALVPGGIIVINTVGRRESVGVAWVGLWLLAATASGGTYDFLEYKTMLENAGFIQVEDINQGPIRAVKP